MGRSNLQLPGPQIRQQPAGIMVAQPINDTQMLCLVASNLPQGSARERVEMAIQITEQVLSRSVEVSARIGKAVEMAQAQQRVAMQAMNGQAEEPKGVLVG